MRSILGVPTKDKSNMNRTAGKTKTMEKLLSRINHKRNKRRIGLIVGVLVTEFGGIEGFVFLLTEHEGL